MKKPFIIFSQLREEIKNSESQIPLSPPQKQAGKGIRLKSPCPHCGDTSPPRTGAGRKPGLEAISAILARLELGGEL
jgi:hypothetical protein